MLDDKISTIFAFQKATTFFPEAFSLLSSPLVLNYSRFIAVHVQG